MFKFTLLYNLVTQTMKKQAAVDDIDSCRSRYRGCPRGAYVGATRQLIYAQKIILAVTI